MGALSLTLLAATAGVSPVDGPPTTRIREAVQRSVRYIQEKGVWWIKEKKCVSCHRVNTMVWSLSEARRHRFEISDKLDEWVKWSTEISLSKNDKGKVIGLGNKEGVAQILLSLNRSADQKQVRAKLASLLLDGQQSDGSWKAGGQLPSQKRPKSETASVSTMWITLALIDNDADVKSPGVVDQAVNYIKTSPSGKSIEWHAVRLLLAAEQNDRPMRDQVVEKLRERQQSDGGWGWLFGERSDALGTGLALYALMRAGLNCDDASVKRAQHFLIRTQHDDGSWAVNGTKANKKESIQETAVYWGTTWAALGLMASLPDDR